MKKTPQDYHALAAKRGYKWLGPEVPNVHTKTWWECSKGHQWETMYSHVRQGSGCPYCSGKAPKTPQDYHDLATERGFKWLGPEVANVRTKTRWECPKGHKWEVMYSHVRQGSGCPHCSGLARKEPADYHDLATERGFKWLGPEVAKVRTKTRWECSKGHQWEAAYNYIQSDGSCPYCTVWANKTPQHHHNLATERGFKWLGPEVANGHTKTWWECPKGHKWKMVYSYIQQGTGCPRCRKPYKGELRIAEVLNGMGITHEQQRTFVSCKNSRPLPFDFYFVLDGKQYLIEYQGQQHYHPVKYFGGARTLRATQKRDAIKAQFAKDNGYHLIVIPYTEYENIEQIVKGEVTR